MTMYSWLLRHRTILIILALGLLLRLAWLVALWDHPFTADEAEYLRIAQSIHQGNYLDHERWLRPPLYPLWLALAIVPGDTLLGPRLAQVVLGMLLIVLLFLIARRAWTSEATAHLSALLAACYFPLIGYSNYLMADMLLTVVLSGVMLTLLHIIPSPGKDVDSRKDATSAKTGQRPDSLYTCSPICGIKPHTEKDVIPSSGKEVDSRKDATSAKIGQRPDKDRIVWRTVYPYVISPVSGHVVLAGVLMGLALLTKPAALAALPAFLAAFWLCGGTYSQRLGHMLLALACVGAVVAPWSIRNTRVYGHSVPLDTTGGYNLWFGNHPPDQGGTLFEHTMEETYPNLAERNAAYLALARDNVLANPLYTLQRLGSKAIAFWRLEADAVALHQFVDLTLECPRSDDQPKAIIEGDAFGTTRPACWWRTLNLASDVLSIPLLVGMLIAFVWVPGNKLIPHSGKDVDSRKDATSAKTGQRPDSLYHCSPVCGMTTVGWLWILAFYGLGILTVVQTRLRLPLAPVMIPCAAAGLMKLSLAVRHHIERSRAFWWRMATTVILLVVGVWVLHIIPLTASQIAQWRGQHAWKSGDPAQALHHYRQAVAWYPQRTGILVEAGQVAEAVGYDSESLVFYHNAINMVYYQAQARIGIARILQQQENLTEAEYTIEGTALSQGQIERISFATSIVPPHDFLDIGGPAVAEYGYVLGLYPTETVSHTPTFRWTSTRAALRFGTLPTPESLLQLRMSTIRSDQAQSPQVKIFVNGTYVTSVSVLPGWWRIYTVTVPPTEQGILVRIESDTVPASEINPQDTRTRQTGIALDWVALEPVRSKQE